jgi:hypothetical protein
VKRKQSCVRKKHKALLRYVPISAGKLALGPDRAAPSLSLLQYEIEAECTQAGGMNSGTQTTVALNSGREPGRSIEWLKDPIMGIKLRMLQKNALNGHKAKNLLSQLTHASYARTGTW